MPLLAIYKKLAALERGAFIYRTGESNYFVEAHRLAADLFRNGPKAVGAKEARNRAALSLEQALDRARDRALLIEIPVPVEVTMDTAPLQQRGDAVFSVVENGAPLGWFLNHETLLDPATKRVVFLCENGHENRDQDHGVCYTCPGRITGPKP